MASTRKRALSAAADGAELMLLPEYFFLPHRGGARKVHLEAFDVIPGFLKDVSSETGAGVAGNAPFKRGNHFENVGLLFDRGKPILRQAKLRPMPRERSWGIRAGKGISVAKFRDIKTAFIVCADVLFPELSRQAGEKGARLLLNPVMSPNREPDPTRDAREALYVARSYDSAAFVLKAAGTLTVDSRLRIAGRSLIASPWGLLARYRSERIADTITARLDFGKLEGFRKTHPAIAAGARLH